MKICWKWGKVFIMFAVNAKRKKLWVNNKNAKKESLIYYYKMTKDSQEKKNRIRGKKLNLLKIFFMRNWCIIIIMCCLQQLLAFNLKYCHWCFRLWYHFHFYMQSREIFHCLFESLCAYVKCEWEMSTCILVPMMIIILM